MKNVDVILKNHHNTIMPKVKKITKSAYIPAPLDERVERLKDLGLGSFNGMVVEGLYIVVAKKEKEHGLIAKAAKSGK